MSIHLGNIVRDRITGFRGVANSRTVYFNGCVRIGIQPQKLTKDGKTLEGEYFDEAQVEVLSQGLAPRAARTGGPEKPLPAFKNPPTQ